METMVFELNVIFSSLLNMGNISRCLAYTGNRGTGESVLSRGKNSEKKQ